MLTHELKPIAVGFMLLACVDCLESVKLTYKNIHLREL